MLIVNQHHRKPLYGVGINDADYYVQRKELVDGKLVTHKCPIYAAWAGVMTRVYSEKYKKKQPSYYDVSLDERWVKFTAFREWASEWLLQDGTYGDLHLDKDILVPGNRIYGPDTCAFVPAYINNLLHCRKPIVRRYELPIGVYWSPINRNYFVTCKVNGKAVYLGASQCPYKAHQLWQLGKAESIENTLRQYSIENYYRESVNTTCLARVALLREHVKLGVQTDDLFRMTSTNKRYEPLPSNSISR